MMHTRANETMTNGFQKDTSWSHARNQKPVQERTPVKRVPWHASTFRLNPEKFCKKNEFASSTKTFLRTTLFPLASWVSVKIIPRTTNKPFSLWFHLPGFHFGYLSLTHTQLRSSCGGPKKGLRLRQRAAKLQFAWAKLRAQSAGAPKLTCGFHSGQKLQHMAVVVKTNEIPFWGRCTTHFSPFWRGLGCLTRGYGILTHGHMGMCLKWTPSNGGFPAGFPLKTTQKGEKNNTPIQEIQLAT